ncbi:MAG: hypothetical protein ACE5MI_12145 [Acidimicrobiia bacterium]
MRRFLLPIAILVLAAACGPTPAQQEAQDPTPAPEARAAQALPAGGLFAYSYEPGGSYTYSFRLIETMDITFDTQGNAAFLDGEEPPPESVQADVLIGGTVTYDVAAGPEPDTYEITVSGTFDEMSVNGTVDGQPMPDGMDLSEAGAPELIEVPSATIVIDSQGRVIEGAVGGEPLPSLDLFADPFSSFEGITSGGLNGHFGPAFPEGPLEMGEMWTHTVTEQIMDQTFTAESTYVVDKVTEVDGAKLAVINTTRSFSGLTLDLGEMFVALFQGFAEMSEDPGAEAQLADGLDFTFLISLAPSTASGNVSFDPALGLTTQWTQNTNLGMTMDFAMDDGNQAGSMKMNMLFDIAIEAQLEA